MGNMDTIARPLDVGRMGVKMEVQVALDKMVALSGGRCHSRGLSGSVR